MSIREHVRAARAAFVAGDIELAREHTRAAYAEQERLRAVDWGFMFPSRAEVA